MMAGDSQRVMETTTINYHGMIAVLDPTSSWAAKWLHVGASLVSIRFCSRACVADATHRQVHSRTGIQV